MELDGIKIERVTTVDRVVEAIRRALFDGKINPGEQLREMTLAKKFAVSRSTIREALRIMTAAGLTTYAPNKGVMARQLTREEIDDIFLTRQVLETAAVNLLSQCPSARLNDLSLAMDNYAAAAKSGDTLETADAHTHFHSTLVGLTGSQRLMETEKAVMNDLQLVIATIDKHRDDQDREIAKHRALMHLLLDGKRAEARQWISDDLALAKGFVMEQISFVGHNGPQKVAQNKQ